MIGSKLKNLRLKKNYTVKYVCDALNIPNRTYRGYELDESTPHVETICKIADFYAVSVDWLLGRDTTQRANYKDYQKQIYKDLAEIKRCQEDINDCLERMGIICPTS